MQTPKEIVAERSTWASKLRIADHQLMQEVAGPALADQMDAANLESGCADELGELLDH